MNVRLVCGVAVMGVALVATGCEASGPLVVSGQVALSTFPTSVTKIEVVGDGGVLSGAALALDGTFSVEVPGGGRVHLELVGPDGRYGLVFPRDGGAIDYGFGVGASATPFDLGEVRYVGDPTTRRFDFEVGCKPGPDLDRGMAVTCIDDSADPASTCDGGHGCHFGGDHEFGDRDEEPALGDEELALGAEALPGAAAVVDHNLPAFVGCSGDEMGPDGPDFWWHDGDDRDGEGR